MKYCTRLAQPVGCEAFHRWPGGKAPQITPEELKKLLVQCVENAQFQVWSKGEVPGVRFVHACEFGTIWKFTPKAWWLFVNAAIRNQGCHDFALSKALRSRPTYIVKGDNNNFYPLDWSSQDWTNELSPDKRLTPKHDAD